MNTVSPATLNATSEARADSGQPRHTPLLAMAGRIALKAFLVASGLAVGGFLGLVIAAFSGLIEFAC